MDERSDQIEADQIKRSIDLERADLGRNVQQLQDDLRTAVDWRFQFRRNPIKLMGLAFGTGLVGALLLGGGRCPAVNRRVRESGR